MDGCDGEHMDPVHSPSSKTLVVTSAFCLDLFTPQPPLIAVAVTDGEVEQVRGW
ncbi:hypothetical protein F2Q69_00043432 [Brassica cretica]|uniref:Uncharacterized protein n=1 Tax=Brassica cretica TaxID=69181 RepID=A0A8S9NND3_BRACR|nr:hypothetical protein F2Q69_00043432 [Brassica cretica]